MSEENKKQDIFSNVAIHEDMERFWVRQLQVEELCGWTVLVIGATSMLSSYFMWYLIWLNEQQQMDSHLYHNDADMYQILLYLQRFSYRFYLAYYTVMQSELILYADCLSAYGEKGGEPV